MGLVLSRAVFGKMGRKNERERHGGPLRVNWNERLLFREEARVAMDGTELSILHVKMAEHCIKTLQSSRVCPSPTGPPPSGGRARTSRPRFLLGAKGGGENERETKAHARPLPSRSMAAGKRPCSLRMRATCCGSAVAGLLYCPDFIFFPSFSVKTLRGIWGRAS